MTSLSHKFKENPQCSNQPYATLLPTWHNGKTYACMCSALRIQCTPWSTERCNLYLYDTVPLANMWTSFNSYFIPAFRDEFQKKVKYIRPSSIKSVSALPCEILMFTVQVFVIARTMCTASDDNVGLE